MFGRSHEFGAPGIRSKYIIEFRIICRIYLWPCGIHVAYTPLAISLTLPGIDTCGSYRTLTHVELNEISNR